MEYIKAKIQEAMTAKELKMARYNTYQALNGIERTKHNLRDCGCTFAQELIDRALSQLKDAAKADSLSEAEPALVQAFEDTLRGLEALREFMETGQAMEGDRLPLDAGIAREPEWLLHIPDTTVREQVEASLSAFENSLEGILREVECKEAHGFIAKIQGETRTILLNGDLSKHKKAYYLRLMALTEQAMEKLGTCGN